MMNSSDERSDINMSTSIELMRRKVRFMVGGAVCDALEASKVQESDQPGELGRQKQ